MALRSPPIIVLAPCLRRLRAAPSRAVRDQSPQQRATAARPLPCTANSAKPAVTPAR